jgi:hypothetical protein
LCRPLPPSVSGTPVSVKDPDKRVDITCILCRKFTRKLGKEQTLRGCTVMTREDKLKEKYKIFETSLYFIRNRNETRVINKLPEILEEYTTYSPNIIDIQDIYALTLNKLEPRYTQQFSIVFNEPVSDEDIEDAIRKAIEKVKSNPKTPSN